MRQQEFRGPDAIRVRVARTLLPGLHPGYLVTIALALTAAPAFAQDRADIDRTQIIGNRELPKVLYIVPWKKPLPVELTGRPVVSVLYEALAPVDRDVFRRQVQYDALVQPKTPVATATPATPATPAAK
jgi:hypothetical protein